MTTFNQILTATFLSTALSTSAAPVFGPPVGTPMREPMVLKHHELCMSGNLKTGVMEYFSVAAPMGQPVIDGKNRLNVPEDFMRDQHRILSRSLAELSLNQKSKGGSSDTYLRQQVTELNRALRDIDTHRKTGAPALSLCGASV